MKKKSKKLKSWLRKFLINLSVFLIALIIMILIAELLIRIAIPVTLYQGNYDSSKHYYNHPSNSEIELHNPQIFNPEFVLFYETNSRGFYDSERSYENPDNRIRIIAVGDSFTEGMAAQQNQSFVSLLGDRLGNNYEIINLGVGGTDIGNYYYTYKNEGALYSPKYVVMGFFIGNDIRSQPQMILLNDSDYSIIEIAPPVETSLFLRTRQFLAKHSALYNVLVYLLNSNSLTSGLMVKLGLFVPHDVDIYWTSTRQELDDGLSTTAIMLKKMNKMVSDNGSKLIVVMIPAKEQVDDAKYDSFYKSKNLVPYAGQFEGQDYFNKFCEQQNIECLDLLPEFRASNVNNTFYWNIDGHWNAAGHKLASELIYERITQFENK